MFLTKRQRDVLAFVERFLREHGNAPSLKEIAKGIGVKSVSTVHRHLTNLQRLELIDRDWNRGRSLALVPGVSSTQAVVVPLRGRMAAGEPLELVAEGRTIGLPEELAPGPDTFVLQVKGDSMIDDQIRDGDYVIVERRRSVKDGETVVASIAPENAVTVKAIYREEAGLVRLQPANARLLPMLLPAERVEIQGVVVGLLRKY